MSDFEREDLELQFVMGEKFVDETKPTSEAKAKETFKKACEKYDEAIKKMPDDIKEGIKARNAEWHPTKEHTWMDSLTECAKWVMTFGGLNFLIFYWQLNGLMAESIAVPSMWVCCALAGFGVGLNIWRGAK